MQPGCAFILNPTPTVMSESDLKTPYVRALEQTSTHLERDIQAARSTDPRKADYLRERLQELERELKPSRTGSDPQTG